MSAKTPFPTSAPDEDLDALALHAFAALLALRNLFTLEIARKRVAEVENATERLRLLRQQAEDLARAIPNPARAKVTRPLRQALGTQAARPVPERRRARMPTAPDPSKAPQSEDFPVNFPDQAAHHDFLTSSARRARRQRRLERKRASLVTRGLPVCVELHLTLTDLQKRRRQN